MSFLKPTELKLYKNGGYVAAIDVFSKEEASEVREEFDINTL